MSRIDIHCHLIPAIDDGCISPKESLESIRMLIDHGYTASICTPHHWPQRFPHITPDHVAIWVDDLQKQVTAEGLDYTLYAGGEMRVARDTPAELDRHEPPTLAGSRYVLMDFWEPRWPKFLDKTADWLLDHQYQPILAHPERSVTGKEFDRMLDRLTDRGVLLQGNLRSFTGCNGPVAANYAKWLLREDRYTLLALDAHRPDSLPDRLAGLEIVTELVGSEKLAELIEHRPKAMFLNAEPA